MTRSKLLVVLLLTLLGGAILGALCVAGVGAVFLRSTEDTHLIADATLYLSVLEQLRAKNPDGAGSMVTNQLRAAAMGLRADEDRLSNTQRQQFAAIQARLSKFSEVGVPLAR